jgi:hypothetical protein
MLLSLKNVMRVVASAATSAGLLISCAVVTQGACLDLRPFDTYEVLKADK